ncbi:hypothetical protein PTI98_010877 [Pleurotus ostreatus]|nr:hypothetical protein PTI98_010877 [Pleurotus ostreatus]
MLTPGRPRCLVAAEPFSAKLNGLSNYVLQDANNVMPPWATVAIALIIFAIFMIIVGVICHRFGCLGSSPSSRNTPMTNATSPSNRHVSYTPPPSRRVSQTQAAQLSPQRPMHRKERPMSQVVGLTSSETVNRAMLHPPPPAYTPSAARSSYAPIAPVIEKGYSSISGSRVSRNTSKSSTQFPIMNN